MDFRLETLLLALGFLLPGFLTSRLIATRTPALGRQPTPFTETLESLLRSVSIHLITIPIMALILRGFFQANPDLSAYLYKIGIFSYMRARPFQVTTILFFWLSLSFVIAIGFGYKFDPIEKLYDTIVSKTGTVTNDPFYTLREKQTEKKKQFEDAQIWMQVRLKNGYTYRGQPLYVGYQEKHRSREILLQNVKFFPYPAQASNLHPTPPKTYDYVFIDLDNCNSVEVLFGNTAREVINTS